MGNTKKEEIIYTICIDYFFLSMNERLMDSSIENSYMELDKYIII